MECNFDSNPSNTPFFFPFKFQGMEQNDIETNYYLLHDSLLCSIIEYSNNNMFPLHHTFPFYG